MSPARDASPSGTRVWWVAFAVLVLVVAVIGAWVWGRPHEAAGPTPTPSAAPTPTIPPIAREKVWTSDTPASGTNLLNTLTAQPALAAPKTVTYVVKVEDTTQVVPDEAAAEIQKTFDDPRGWAGYGKRNFTLIAEEKQAALVIYIASPTTTDQLCKPADVESKWNCRVGGRVVLNSDRWRFMTPTYDDLGAYRSYLVNHEVGHYLGQGHVGCPQPGNKAPVMMQQSIDLAGCSPNAWPKDAD